MNRIVTYHCPSGLANRLRLHCIAQAYAMYTGRRLLVEWERNHVCHAQFHDLFDSELQSVEQLPLLERLSLFVDRKLSCHQFGRGSLPGGYDVTMLPDVSDRIVHFRADTEASIDNGSRMGSYKERVISSLTPIAEVTDRVDQFMERMDKKCFLVGIHIRMGDFVRKYGDGLPPLKRYIDIATYIVQSCPEVQFILVSDGGNKVIHAIQNELGDVVQMRCGMENSRTSVKGLKDALTDMVLLSKCDIVIGTPDSSFSAFGALLGNVPLIRADHSWQNNLSRTLATRTDGRTQPFT